MPDVTAARNAAILLVVVGDLNAVDDALCGRDLIRPHDQQQILRGEDAILREDIEERMPREERAREVHQIGNGAVVRVSPEGRKLKAVAGFALFGGGGRLLHHIVAGGIGVILGVGAVGDDEDLHIFKQAAACPEGIPLIAVDLVKGLADGHAAALELDMHKRQAVDQHGYIISVIVPCASRRGHLVLVDDLQAVIVDVLLVDQHDIAGCAVIAFEHLHMIFLNLAGLFHNMLHGIGHSLGKKAVPFTIGKGIVIQQLQLAAQVGNQILFSVNGKIDIALLLQMANQLLFQRGLGLIAGGLLGNGRVFGDDRVFVGFSHNVEVGHGFSSCVELISSFFQNVKIIVKVILFISLFIGCNVSQNAKLTERIQQIGCCR